MSLQGFISRINGGNVWAVLNFGGAALLSIGIAGRLDEAMTTNAAKLGLISRQSNGDALRCSGCARRTTNYQISKQEPHNTSPKPVCMVLPQGQL